MFGNAYRTQIQVLEQDKRILEANYTTRIEEASQEIAALNAAVEHLGVALQAATDPLTGAESETSSQHYVGNPYKSYSTQVEAMHSKYDLKDDWGCMTLKNVVDVRAAFMIGRGVQVAKRMGFAGSAARELAFVRDFIKFNNIDEEAPQDWAVGTELEGKVLLRLLPAERDLAPAMVRAIYVPWNAHKYTITADEPNYYRYLKAHYTGTAARPDSTPVDVSFDLTENQFVYKRFGGSAHAYNETAPKAAFVLRHIEDLDKDLWDWRKINHLFAAPTPAFTVETTAEAERLEGRIDNKNWRIGKAIVIAGGKMELIAYKGEGFTTLQKAVESYVQAISGATGVPVHFLGHPELLSNRATAENLLELIELSTGKERKVWMGAYEELFQKAIIMHNELYRDNLEPLAITAEIPFTSSQSLKLIKDVYLPMYMAGALSLEQLLSYLSEVDADQEIERIKKDRADDLSPTGAAASNGGAGNVPNGGPGVAGTNQSRR